MKPDHTPLLAAQPLIHTMEPDDIDPPLIAATCVGMRARVINRAISAIYQEELRPWKVTISQTNLLVAIASHGPLGPRDLVKPMQMDKSTLSRNLERMREQGWIAVEPEEGHPGPSKRLAITDEGRTLLKALTPGWRRAQVRLERLLGRTLLTSLDDVSRRLVQEH